MAVEVWLLVATTLIAAVAIVVAALAVRSVQSLKRELVSAAPVQPSLQPAAPAPEAMPAGSIVRSAELAPRVVEGRVIVPPTQAQVVRTALGRPGVRLSVLIHGLAHALRAENRDRIVALMRREYEHRRRERLRAGRAAIRSAHPSPAPTTERLHAELLEPRPEGLAERMVNP